MKMRIGCRRVADTDQGVYRRDLRGKLHDNGARMHGGNIGHTVVVNLDRLGWCNRYTAVGVDIRTTGRHIGYLFHVFRREHAVKYLDIMNGSCERIFKGCWLPGGRLPARHAKVSAVNTGNVSHEAIARGGRQF